MIFALLAAYLCAGLWPTPALALRSSLPQATSVLLSVLLFNAALSGAPSALRRLFARPRIAIWALCINIALPIAFTLVTAGMLSSWHNADELQSVLVALAIIGAMPIAGSSAGWAQHAGGNVVLSLGLVIASTLLSPLLTPLALRVIALVTSGDYSEDLAELADGSARWFLIVAVVVPWICAAFVQRLAGPTRMARALPTIKRSNVAVLLLLNYLNAAVALPVVFANPDVDFIALVSAVALLLCGLSFAAGHWLGLWSGASRQERTSLVFALGMSNNGSALVLATNLLADHTRVLLVIVMYNLVQQLVAAGVDFFHRDPPALSAHHPGRPNGDHEKNGNESLGPTVVLSARIGLATPTRSVLKNV